MVDDPRSPRKDVHIFILYTRGHKSRSKCDIINEYLICFVDMHKMKKVASGLTDSHRYAYEYQSTTRITMSNLLFSNFSEYGILYKHPKDFFLGKGTYIALLDKKNSKIPKERIDFGALPNQSAIDLDSFQKIGKAIKEKKSRPYDNYKDMIMLLNFLI